MKSCCVVSCEIKSEDVIFFEFPTSRSLRRRWLDAVKPSGKLPPTAAVCSKHFAEEDYESVRGKVRLKRKVVPTLMLGDQKTTVPPPSPKPEATEAASPLPSPPDTAKTHSVSPHTNETENCRTNGTEGDDNSDSETSPLNPIPEEPDPKQDIEEMITNYQIKNKPNSELAARISEDLRRSSASRRELVEVEVDMTPDLIMLPEVEPFYIEVPVDKDETMSGAGGGSQDCLMLLESVQVDVDPAALFMPEPDEHDERDEHEHDDNDKAPHKKQDPISLLTSSDDDDVILEEPHIDTVEVSDETDEDDLPLTRLLKPKTKKTKKPTKTKKVVSKTEKTLKMVMWGRYDFYCIHCHYTTASKVDFNNHMAAHAKVLQICSICSYTTASKAQYSRHMRRHKEEKRFKCHLCGFKAKHNMSLIYHLKSHDKTELASAKRGFKCKKCNFKSDVKSVMLKHVGLCGSGTKIYNCKECEYETARKSDLKRHRLRRHKKKEEDEDDDDDLFP